MANVRENDTSLWLHNKLGNSNELWSNGSICSQLNVEVLKNIRDCFTELQSLVKLKLLLSFLHIQRRNVEEVSLYSNIIWFILPKLLSILKFCLYFLFWRIFYKIFQVEVWIWRYIRSRIDWQWPMGFNGCRIVKKFSSNRFN